MSESATRRIWGETIFMYAFYDADLRRGGGASGSGRRALTDPEARLQALE